MRLTTMEQLVGQAIGISTLPLCRDSIEVYQLRQLKERIAYCRARSSVYRDRLNAAGIGDITSLADLPSLPLTSSEDVRQHGLAMVCVSQDEIARIITLHSSGTTGAPKRLFFTEEDIEATRRFFQIGMQNLVAPGQTVAILLPGATPDSTGHLLAVALERMQVLSHIIGLVDNPEQAARQLALMRPDVLVGFPVQILAIAQTAAHHGLDLDRICSVLLCSDYIPESLSLRLEALLGCEVFSHYGTVETGLGGGVDCAAHQGAHVRAHDLLVEVIDQDTAKPMEPGQWGELVVTTLTRTGMPLIRYRTGDLGRLLPGPCPCGSYIQRLDKIRGRIDQIRTLLSGKQLTLAELDELLFTVPGLLDFKASLRLVNRQDTLHLDLSVLPGLEENILAQAAKAVAPLRTDKHPGIALALSPGALVQRGKRILEDQRKDKQA